MVHDDLLVAFHFFLHIWPWGWPGGQLVSSLSWDGWPFWPPGLVTTRPWIPIWDDRTEGQPPNHWNPLAEGMQWHGHRVSERASIKYGNVKLSRPDLVSCRSVRSYSCSVNPVQSIASWFFTVATWKTESLELNFVCLRFNLFWYGVWKGGTQYCLFYHQMSPKCSSSIYISYILIWNMRSEHLRNHGMQWGFPTNRRSDWTPPEDPPGISPSTGSLCSLFTIIYVPMYGLCKNDNCMHIYIYYIPVVRTVTYTCVVPSQKAEEKPTIWIPIRSVCWGIMRVLMSCQGNKLSKGKWSKSFVHRDVQSWPNLKFTVLHFFKVSFYGPDIASVLDSATGVQHCVQAPWC